MRVESVAKCPRCQKFTHLHYRQDELRGVPIPDSLPRGMKCAHCGTLWKLEWEAFPFPIGEMRQEPSPPTAEGT